MAKPTCSHEGNTHCIHNSERKSFSGCRQKWDFSYRQHLTPFNPILPLEFGTAIHKGMEVFFNPELWGKIDTEEKLQRALVAFDEENDRQRARYIAQAFADDTLDNYEDRKRLGAGMLTNYARNIHPVYDTWFKPVRTEVSFHIPLMDENGDNIRCYNPGVCGQDHEVGAIVTLDGTIDVLVHDLRNGGYYIIDWKTARTLLTNDKHLYIDNQIGTYPAALSLVLGVNVKGFIYIQLRKDFPQAPEELSRRYKKKLYSTRKDQATTYDLAKMTYETYDNEAYRDGHYDEYLKSLKENPTKFDARFAIRQTEIHAKNVLLDAAKQAKDMVSFPNIYPEPSENCKNCTFYEPCLEKLNGEDYEFTLQENYVNNAQQTPSYELEDDLDADVP